MIRSVILVVAILVALLLGSDVALAEQPQTSTGGPTQTQPQSTATPLEPLRVVDIRFDPASGLIGRPVIVKATITNINTVPVSRKFDLLVNSLKVGSQDITVAAGALQVVEFRYVPSVSGNLTVSIDDKVAYLPVVGEAKQRTGPTVRLRPLNDEVTRMQDGLVELFVLNPGLNDLPLTVEMEASVPSGIHILGQGIALSGGAGMVYGQFTVNPGQSITVYLNIKSEKVGAFFIHGAIRYYTADCKDCWQPVSLTHPFVVKEPSGSEEPTPVKESWWDSFVGSVPFLATVSVIGLVIIGILAAWALHRVRTEVTLDR